jgi:hypothetical protein
LRFEPSQAIWIIYGESSNAKGKARFFRTSGNRHKTTSASESGPCGHHLWYNQNMRISLFLILTGLFALLPWGGNRAGRKRRRLLNVEEAVRLLGEHAVF